MLSSFIFDIFLDIKYISYEEVFTITVYNKNCDVASILYKKGVWSNSELNILSTYYPIGGSSLCKEKGLARSQYAILNKAFKLNLKINARLEWSDSEIELLKEHYHKGITYLKNKGLNKSINDIKLKAKDLKLVNYSYWNDKELEILKKFYKEGVAMVKGKGVNKSTRAIYCKAHRMGLTKSGYTFTAIDISLLEKYYSLGGAEYVKLKGLDIDLSLIESKAIAMDLKRYDENSPGSNGWSINDTDIIIRYYLRGGYPLCKEKGLTKSKISTMAKADQLKLKRFSDFEVEVAIDNELSLNDKLDLIGSNRSTTEIKNVYKYRDI